MENKKNLKAILLPNAIGDWTTFKPQISDKKKNRTSIRGSIKLSEDELFAARLYFLELFEKYAQNLQKNAGIPLSAKSISIDQMTYPEILKEWDLPAAQFKMIIDTGEPWQICFDSVLANALINRCVGGEPESATSKGLTEIEENILLVCAKEGLDIITGLNIEDLSLQFVNYPNLFFDQTYSETSPFIIVAFELGMGRGQKGTIILIIPVKSVRQLIEDKSNESDAVSLSRLPQQIIDKLKVPVSVFLGSSFITAKELYELEDGDVVLLDTLLSSPLQVKIGEHLQLFGQPGIKGNKISVSLLQNKSKKLERIKVEESADEDHNSEDIFENQDVNNGILEEQPPEEDLGDENIS